MPRFKTLLRGAPVEVQMTIVGMDPPIFTIDFPEGHPGEPLTRQELAALCREAGRVSAAEDKKND